MAADVRRRFGAACKRLGLPVREIAAQFDRWRYTPADYDEMRSWPDSTVMQHALLLRDEIERGIAP